MITMRKHNYSFTECVLRIITGMLPAAGMLLLPGCRAPHSDGRLPKQHLALHRHERTTIYVDRIDNRVVLDDKRTVPGINATIAAADGFRSFLIGRQDSAVAADNRTGRAEEEYFQYTMQNEWVALTGGDTLRPVFFQEKTSMDKNIKEGVMVFELPAAASIDTLIYRDSFDGTKPDIFVVNRK
jgi:hypothetical protein